MKPEQWQQLDQLYHSALEREPDGRSLFLDEACMGNSSLRKEVEALLAAHEDAGSFIERPAMAVEARGVAADRGNLGEELAMDTTVSHYRIISPLGSGGMGDVYLAQDTVLNRQVALKLLPENFTTDRDRLRRFQQEARAASALNHPNIITIYEIGQVDDRHFIVTEFIDGQTLRQQSKGPHSHTTGDGGRTTGRQLKLNEILNVAIQTTDALSAAHEAGIVHRDVKPENIMVRRRDGYVKVLDFGLVKLTEGPALTVDPEGPTRTQVKTSAGVVMGTASYMSPEQARGDQVDVRTDIWSLGVVLYEMVAGCGPFERSTPSEIIALILEREPPPLARYARDVPAELERIVRKALTKDREERYQTAKDLLVDLRRLRQRLDLEIERERFGTHGPNAELAVTTAHVPMVAETTNNSAARTDPDVARRTSSAEYFVSEIKRHRRTAFAALIIVAIAMAGGGFGLYKFLNRSRTNTRITAGSAKIISRLTNTGNVSTVAISPDGKYVAYGLREPAVQSVRIKQVNTNADQVIVPPEKAEYGNLNFSRDSSYLFYQKGFNKYGDGELERVPVLGGQSQKLIADVGSAVTFSPDGNRLAFVRSSQAGDVLILANADGSGEQKLASRQNPSRLSGQPAWSPDGKLIAVTSKSLTGGLHLELIGIEAESGNEIQISSHKWQKVLSIAWLPDVTGLVLSATEGVEQLHLWQVSYPDGEARRLTADLNSYSTVSMSADGRTLAAVQSEKLSNIWVVPDGDAKRVRQITLGAGKYDVTGGVSWTPDGKVVFAATSTDDNFDIWIVDADGSNQKQLTAIGNNGAFPEVTPDGRYIVFTSARSGVGHIWRIDIDGGNPRQLTNGIFDTRPHCSADSQWVIYGSAPPQLDPGMQYNRNLWKVSIDGGTPVQLSDDLSWEGVASPDGKLIAAMYRDPQEEFKVAIIPFGGGSPIKLFDMRTNNLLRWTVDGRAITHIDTREGVSNIWSQPVDGGPPTELTNFKSEQIAFYDWSRDGKQLACSRFVTTRDVVLIRDFR